IFHLRTPRSCGAVQGVSSSRAAPYIAATCDRQYLRGQPYPLAKPLHRQIYRAAPGNCVPRLIADGKALPDMGRTLDLVGHRNREVLERDPALAVRIDQQLVLSQTELAGPVPEIDQCRGRQEGPIEVVFLLQPV